MLLKLIRIIREEDKVRRENFLQVILYLNNMLIIVIFKIIFATSIIKLTIYYTNHEPIIIYIKKIKNVWKNM